VELKDRTRWAINFIAKKEKLSNPKIGKIIGVKADTVNAYRSKLANPKVDFIIKFCDTFGIDLLWFTKGYGEPFPGAKAKHPEVCSPSRYETQGQSGFHPPSSAEAPFSPTAPFGAEDSETNRGLNPTEKRLAALCKQIGIPISRGWKTTLADFLDITPAQLSNSIARNRISKNLLIRIEEKGFPTRDWFPLGEAEETARDKTDTDHIAVEISLQKLAILAGIKIDMNWIANLSGILEAEPWHINMAILQDRIGLDLLHLIKEKGYSPKTWVVAHPGPAKVYGDMVPYSRSDLLKMADTVLQSGTAHATSLAMSIISMNTAVVAEQKRSGQAAEKEKQAATGTGANARGGKGDRPDA
jgi:transcriptional regulator with XRE-family HTH domain